MVDSEIRKSSRTTVLNPFINKKYYFQSDAGVVFVSRNVTVGVPAGQWSLCQVHDCDLASQSTCQTGRTGVPKRLLSLLS